MASVRNEAPNADGVGCGEGSGEEAMPPPQKIFELKMVSFGAFLELILLQLNCLCACLTRISR